MKELTIRVIDMKGNLLNEHELMFDYLDWCKDKGCKRIEETENRELINQYFREHDNIELNGYLLGLLDGTLWK